MASVVSFYILALALAVATASAQQCAGGDFKYNASGYQYMGLTSVPSATSADACATHCCNDKKCNTWQFCGGSACGGEGGGCWAGDGKAGDKAPQWTGMSTRAGPPPPPPPPQGPYTVDATPGLGMRWEGVGAISGGGATTKLLMDYDAATASDILDFLFLPNFGLDLDILKVEVGGDTDSTEGAEPSHMHYAGDEDYNRGYEWWLMKEAKKRKPSLKLYGLPWGWPGWLDPSATADKQASNAFANPNVTANYTLAWLLGAKRVHGLDIDYIGQWNERNAPGAYNDALRAAVAGSELAGTTTVLNRLPHYPGTGNSMPTGGCSSQQWNTTDGRYWVDEEGSIYDGQSARCLARCVNRGYVTGCHTATFQWHLISSFYDYLPWSRCGVAVANRPWDGSYEITSPTWALAHTTQFADPGWRYTMHDSGVTLLENGGSLVTRVSPDLADVSMVIEKMSSHNSNCARGSNPDMPVASEKVVLILKGSVLVAAKAKGLHVWYSNLTSPNGEGPSKNPPTAQLFNKQPAPLAIGADGSVSIDVNPEEIYTITTLSTGQKGAHPSASVPQTPFPLPFSQPFDNESVSAPPAMWYDQMGAWEVQQDADRGGNIMRQVSPVWPACWGYSCSGPLTYFGPALFNGSTGLTVSIDVMLEDHGCWTFGGDSKGISGATLCTNGTSTVSYMGSKAPITAAFAVKTWHTCSLRFNATAVSVTLDGATVGSVGSHGGFDGWKIVMGLDRYIFASADNFKIAA
eukprot:CAMPEP_0206318684 /NCGR_PEP_ID=MMETSP0106_2-20121207/17335_1 /ASSEMBLY_ACC=CAM_ASM_000206 /TAXON_ID=81532 /ORGANISM="Acanthoeca-like sp., Strain 10tr" /LENGTH=746 /DNA_ID=CAMNT_0053750429 /DNA_START=12 /DNA_END=2252 /DNA_ORIENTATION=+